VTPAHRRPAGRGRLAAVLAGGAAVCLGAGAHLLTQPAQADVTDAGTVPVQAPASSVSTAPHVQEVPSSRTEINSVTPRTLPPLVLPPVTFAAPDLHARARVVPVGTDAGGALELPGDPRTLGWWVGGALPGATRGTVVVAGHIDTKEGGAGVMAGVIRLPLGARVSLTDAAGAQRIYRVVAVRSYPKRALPARLFTGAPTARLVLVTCGGTFDAAAHRYSDNIVVYGVPVDA
jgi:hypothetical protein